MDFRTVGCQELLQEAVRMWPQCSNGKLEAGVGYKPRMEMEMEMRRVDACLQVEPGATI